MRCETINQPCSSPFLLVSKLLNSRAKPPTEKFAIRYTLAHLSDTLKEYVADYSFDEWEGEEQT